MTKEITAHDVFELSCKYNTTPNYIHVLLRNGVSPTAIDELLNMKEYVEKRIGRLNSRLSEGTITAAVMVDSYKLVQKDTDKLSQLIDHALTTTKTKNINNAVRSAMKEYRIQGPALFEGETISK